MSSQRYIVMTQIEENYGAHDWDGIGVCPSRWKGKGGSNYRVNADTAEAAMQAVAAKLPGDTDYFKEYVLSAQTEVEFDAWLSTLTAEHAEFERGLVEEIVTPRRCFGGVSRRRARHGNK